MRIDREPLERLDEARLELPSGNEIVVQKNLGALALSQYIDNSKDGVIRGLLVGDDIYYWDAFFAIHAEIAQALGVPYQVEDRVQITRIDDGPILVDLSHPLKDKAPAPMQRLTRSQNIYFYLEDSGWKSGQDLAA